MRGVSHRYGDARDDSEDPENGRADWRSPWSRNHGTADFNRLQTNGVAAPEMASIAARCHFRLNTADLPVGEFRRISHRGAMLLATVRVR